MKYSLSNNTYIVRIDRGEEVINELLKFAKQENIKGASIQAIGACDEFSVGLYSVSEKRYESIDYKGDYEIVSCLGNLSLNNNEPYLHLHIGCAGKDNKVVGGHLTRCLISGTFECFVTLTDKEIQRHKDNETGLNVFFKEK